MSLFVAVEAVVVLVLLPVMVNADHAGGRAAFSTGC
jgi:hypothetical protein